MCFNGTSEMIIKQIYLFVQYGCNSGGRMRLISFYPVNKNKVDSFWEWKENLTLPTFMSVLDAFLWCETSFTQALHFTLALCSSGVQYSSAYTYAYFTAYFPNESKGIAFVKVMKRKMFRTISRRTVFLNKYQRVCVIFNNTIQSTLSSVFDQPSL